MVNIVDHLWVGSDEDDAKASKLGWSVLVCAKDGQFGHRHMLGYTTKAAPQGKDYLFVRKGNRAAINLIDSDSPSMIPAEGINKGLEFIKEQIDAGNNILVHCNAGEHRGPTTALMYLRTVGEMPSNFLRAESIFKTLYPKYHEHSGIEQFARANWRNLLYEGKTQDVGKKKFTKTEVKYEEHATMKHFCKDCIHFENPSGCEIVQGLINPTGWCDKFSKK